MQVSSVSRVNFGDSQYVTYRNVPKELQTNEQLLEQFAQNNSVNLSINRKSDSIYLPRNDMYTVIARRYNENTNRTAYGVSVLLTQKGDFNKSVLEQLNERVAIATMQVQKEFVEANPTTSHTVEQSLTSGSTKKTFVQKFRNFFKQLLKK